MPLKDLLVSEQTVSEELVEEILEGNARLASDTQKVLLTPEGSRLPARAKVLLVLAAQHAWRFVAPGHDGDISLTVKQIQEQTGLPGNTLRPALKGLKEAYMIESPSEGRYRLPGHALHHALAEVNKRKKK